MCTHLWCVSPSALYEAFFVVCIVLLAVQHSVCFQLIDVVTAHSRALCLSHTRKHSRAHVLRWSACRAWRQHSFLSLSRTWKQVLARVWFGFCLVTHISSKCSNRFTECMCCCCRLSSSVWSMPWHAQYAKAVLFNPDSSYRSHKYTLKHPKNIGTINCTKASIPLSVCGNLMQ